MLLGSGDESMKVPDYPPEVRKQLVDRLNELRIPASFFKDEPLRGVAFFRCEGVLYVRDLPEDELQIRIYKPGTNQWI